MKTQNRDITIGGYVFDEENHVHTLDGKRLYGVTTILGVIAKPALIQWSANEAVRYIEKKLLTPTAMHSMACSREQFLAILDEAKTAHKKKKEDAGTKGTEIHAEIEKYINACLTASLYTPSDMPQVHKFIAWAVENNVKFLASEKHLYSSEWWVGGIADFVCEIDGKRYIGDIKTSSNIYPEHYIQTSAYAKMAVEMGIYDTFDGVVIVNCDKKGGFKVGFNYDLEGNQKCFEAAVTLFKHLEAIK